MSKKVIDNILYRHLLSTINRALFLEYAIRTAEDRHPVEMRKLRELDLKIRQFWIDAGLKEAEINSDDFMDFAWDCIQIGHPLTHTHGRIMHPDLIRIFNEQVPLIAKKFAAAYDELRIAPSQYYRVCDLLRGNDILRTMNSVSQALHDATKYETKDDIFISAFIKHVRVPIHLHPGFRHQAVRGRTENGLEHFSGLALIIDFDAQLTELDIKRQFREFQYRYASLRATVSANPWGDSVTQNLINGASFEDFYGFDGEDPIIWHDGFVNILSGLYCYDRFQDFRSNQSKTKSEPGRGKNSPLDRAVTETLKLYPKDGDPVGEDAIRGNYVKVRRKIKSFEFGSIPQLVGEIAGSS